MLPILALTVLLLFTAPLVRTEWTQPIALEDEDSFGMSTGIAALPDGRRSGVLLSLVPRGLPDKYATYGLRVHDSALQPFHVIDKERGCTQGTFLSESNKIFSVCTGTRAARVSDMQCDHDENSGCSEVLFEESVDGGSTWSKHVFVPRKDPADIVHRRGASIVSIKETSRLYVFYSKTDVYGNSAICYMTRPPGSLIFGQETALTRMQTQLTNFAVIAAVSARGTARNLHVGWIESDQFVYSYSTSGIVWYPPQALSSAVSVSQSFAGAQFLTFPGEKAERICVILVNSEHHGLVRCAEGKLDSSKKLDVLFGQDLLYVSAGMCSKDQMKAMIVARTKDETLKLFEYDAEKNAVKELEAPFAGKFEQEFPQVSCEKDEQDKATAVVKVVAYNRAEQKEYLTINKVPL